MPVRRLLLQSRSFGCMVTTELASITLQKGWESIALPCMRHLVERKNSILRLCASMLRASAKRECWSFWRNLTFDLLLRKCSLSHWNAKPGMVIWRRDACLQIVLQQAWLLFPTSKACFWTYAKNRVLFLLSVLILRNPETIYRLASPVKFAPIYFLTLFKRKRLVHELECVKKI